jgi:hypothetical protein
MYSNHSGDLPSRSSFTQASMSEQALLPSSPTERVKEQGAARRIWSSMRRTSTSDNRGHSGSRLNRAKRVSSSSKSRNDNTMFPSTLGDRSPGDELPDDPTTPTRTNTSGRSSYADVTGTGPEDEEEPQEQQPHKKAKSAKADPLRFFKPSANNLY